MIVYLILIMLSVPHHFSSFFYYYYYLILLSCARCLMFFTGVIGVLLMKWSREICLSCRVISYDNSNLAPSERYACIVFLLFFY